MKTVNLTSACFEEEVIQCEKKVLIDFYADWCAPCRMLSPLVEEIAEEREDIKVCKVNVDAEGELAAAFSVSAIPMLAVMKDGKLEKTSKGLIPKSEILRLLED